MQLVINIDKATYIKAKKQGIITDRTVVNAIASGVPLPKGHGRLKDIDWIDDNCETHHSDKDGSWCYAWRDIDDAPTIIEAESEGKDGLDI